MPVFKSLLRGSICFHDVNIILLSWILQKFTERQVVQKFLNSLFCTYPSGK